MIDDCSLMTFSDEVLAKERLLGDRKFLKGYFLCSGLKNGTANTLRNLLVPRLVKKTTFVCLR